MTRARFYGLVGFVALLLLGWAGWRMTRHDARSMALRPPVLEAAKDGESASKRLAALVTPDPAAEPAAVIAPSPVPPALSPVPPKPVRATPVPLNRAALGTKVAPSIDAAGEPLIPLPLARAALTLVGVDAEAEEAWTAAINDPSLSADARKDLIEDLNEEGFVDPDHVVADDLPLIVNRLAIIEQLAPDAMDDINAAAFQEAYKDLTKMAEHASKH